ncbi:Terminal uridylyltransferase cid1, partial [Bienertia sinuspersici]
MARIDANDKVDLFIGKHHLFKRSVILIKAWCYYESRILGGFHGLISTYALETMVLHVLNLFHSSLDCPSAVLYKFLDYYSTFDWNSYCIGFNGLVPISSLPELVVQLPNDCDDLLLTDAFLRSSRETILSSTNFSGTNNVVFPVKFLNILDPLREDNNLGRSVSKGNFYRIRSALTYGARKLSDILVLPLENIKSGLENFFKDTLELNGKGRRADALVPVSVYDSDISSGNGGNDHLLSGLHYGMCADTSANQQVWNNQWADMNQNAPIDQSMYYSITRSPPSYVDGFKDFRFARGLSVTEKWRSRGTGTYIPHFEHLVQRDIIVEESEEEHESENEQESGKDVEISACTPRDINPSNEGGNIDMFNFSIEEFPLLPGSKPIPIQVPVPIQVSPWNYPEPEQVKDTSASLDSLEFDSIKQSSPTSLSLSEVGKQSDSDVSVVLDLPLLLEDDKEFPPLCRPPEPVITLNKKEFPPLRACLKSQKRGNRKK